MAGTDKPFVWREVSDGGMVGRVATHRAFPHLDPGQFETEVSSIKPLGLVPQEVPSMLGMSFLSFLVLLVIAAVVAGAYHNVFRYRFMEGNDALIGKLFVGWFGAWLGSPVFGYWLWKYENVYIVPAFLGAIAAVHLMTLGAKGIAKFVVMRPVATFEKKEEIRKAA